MGLVRKHKSSDFYTRITDVEILERCYPVRVERFAIRQGSGGAGLHRGGDGAIREFTFLAPVTLSLLTQHRVNGPFGLAGGENGEPGRQQVVREAGEVVALGSVDGCHVFPGDHLILETPGGGGFGNTTFGGAWQEGRNMTLEQAVALAHPTIP